MELALEELKRVLTEGIRKHGSPQFRRTLAEFSEYEIESIYIGRHPVKRAIQYLANLITLGQLEKNKKLLNYDDIYHLYMLIRVRKSISSINRINEVNGTDTTNVEAIIKLHKEEVVELVQLDRAMYEALQAPEHQGFAVASVSHIPFGQFMQKAIQLQGESFWSYDAIKNNCQNFIMSTLRANGIGLSKQQITFIRQDAFTLVGKSPIMSSILKRITDLGAIAHRVRYGTGFNVILS